MEKREPSSSPPTHPPLPLTLSDVPSLGLGSELLKKKEKKKINPVSSNPLPPHLAPPPRKVIQEIISVYGSVLYLVQIYK